LYGRHILTIPTAHKSTCHSNCTENWRLIKGPFCITWKMNVIGCVQPLTLSSNITWCKNYRSVYISNSSLTWTYFTIIICQEISDYRSCYSHTYFLTKTFQIVLHKIIYFHVVGNIMISRKPYFYFLNTFNQLQMMSPTHR
jgi:hypothetical protein